MKIVQAIKIKNEDCNYQTPQLELQNPLVFTFADRMLLENESFYENLKANFNYEHYIFGSTSGEIIGINVHQNSAVVTAIEFKQSSFKIRRANILDYNLNSYALGEALVKSLPKANLKHILAISEGSFTNGSELLKGLQINLKPHILITGGMCGDNDSCQKTLVSYQNKPTKGEVIIIGLYGKELEITCSSSRDWISFGPERTITKVNGNILYEIDHMPALELYIKYLGDKAKELPKAALFYPLSIKEETNSEPVIRTIFQIDKSNNSMILAGNVQQNSKLQLMMASTDNLALGAGKAAEIAMKNRANAPQLVFLVSCAERKLVMDQRVEEELEEIGLIIGEHVPILGLYSYGEMAPVGNQQICELHNQTMTLNLIS